MIRNFANLSLLFSIGVFSLACGQPHKAKVAEKAVREFHSRFNAAKYNEIYQQSHPFMRKQVDEQLFINKLKALQEQIGEFSETAKINENCFIRSSVPTFHGATGLDDVKVFCIIGGSKGVASQEFVWQISSNSETATLYGYQAGQLVKTK